MLKFMKIVIGFIFCFVRAIMTLQICCEGQLNLSTKRLLEENLTLLIMKSDALTRRVLKRPTHQMPYAPFLLSGTHHLLLE